MEYEYKVIFDDGKPFEVFCNSEYSLKKTLMDFYLSQKQVKNENYNAYVFNNKDEDISESQFIEEMIADILDGEAITTKIRRSEDENRYTIASYNALIEEARTIKNFLKIYTDDEYIITKIGLKNSISYKDFKNVSGWEGTEKDLIRLFDAIEDKKIHIKYLDFGYDE